MTTHPRSEDRNGDRAVRRYVLYVGALAATITAAGLLWNSGNAIGAAFYSWAQAANAKRFEDIDARLRAGAQRDTLMLLQIQHLGSWAVQHANDTRAHRLHAPPP